MFACAHGLKDASCCKVRVASRFLPRRLDDDPVSRLRIGGAVRMDLLDGSAPWALVSRVCARAAGVSRVSGAQWVVVRAVRMFSVCWRWLVSVAVSGVVGGIRVGPGRGGAMGSETGGTSPRSVVGRTG